MSKSEEMEGKCIAGCMKGFPKAHTHTHTHFLTQIYMLSAKKNYLWLGISQL